jgi:hypothetical protein
MTTEIEQDIWNWVINYIEVANEFYNYKFPPCPYAKSARLKGLMDVVAYQQGNIKNFIDSQVNDIVENKKFNVRVIVFPAHVRWYFHIHKHVQNLNKTIILKDYYAQYGRALQTSSQYAGIFKGKPYFIVIVNKLSDILSGHQSLLSTDYYDNWTNDHYNHVVNRRRDMYNLYSDPTKPLV